MKEFFKGLHQCLEGSSPISQVPFALPSNTSKVEIEGDSEKQNKANFEVAFYRTLLGLENKFKEINETDLPEDEKIETMTKFLQEIHVMDSDVDKTTELFNSSNSKNNFTSLEKLWEQRLFQKLLDSLIRIPEVLDKIENNLVEIPAEELYLQIEHLEKAYDQLAPSFKANLKDIEQLIIRMRTVADTLKIGVNVPFGLSIDLQSLSKDQQKKLKIHCLTQYRTSLERMEKVIANVATNHPVADRRE